MKFFVSVCMAFLLVGCAVPSKGILLSVEPATPLDERDLHNHCDLGDKAACALKSSDNSEKPPTRFAIVQGIATPDRAVFAALLPADSAISWFVYDRDLNRLWKLNDSRKQKRPGSAWYMQRVEARDLDPRRSYELLAGDKDGNLIEDRIFSTLPQDGKIRFGVISDLKSYSTKNADLLFSAALAKDPSLLIFTGGSLDATMVQEKLPAKRSGALDYFFEKYAASRNIFKIAKERRLVPIAATWSDAEFGLLHGDRTFPFKDQSREVFEMFFPMWADETTIVNGPGVSKIFRFGGQSIALLDERTFRFPENIPKSCEAPLKRKATKKMMECNNAALATPTPLHRFGKIQGEWLFRHAQKTTQPTWLISPEPWMGFFKPGSGRGETHAEWISKLEAPASTPRLSQLQGFTLVETQQSGRIDFSVINEAGLTTSRGEISTQGQ